MKNNKNFHLIVFFQCTLCAILAALCLCIQYRASTRTAQAGSFGFSEDANDTFSHLASRLYREVSCD